MDRLFISLTMMLVALMANAQSCPDNNHPHAIDLGLPSGTKWACCNVGATTPEGYGSYFAWGETEEKEIYDWTTYLHCDGSESTCHDLGSDIAGTEYDVAHVQWGGTWVMPSQDQIKELISKCTICTGRNAVGGELFTGPNGGTIFLPEANEWRKYRDHSANADVNNDGSDSETDPIPDAGYYWASTQRTSNLSHASCILCSNGFAYWDTYNYRSSGLTVRPVISGTSNSIHLKSYTDETGHSIYNLQGIKVAENTADIIALPPGIYIVRPTSRGASHLKSGKRVVLH